MPSVISRIARPLPTDQTWEIRLARRAISRLAPGFNQKVRQQLICDLLGRLAAEKKLREAKNLNHWQEYAPARISAIGERLLAEREEAVTTYLKAHFARLNDLAWRITRSVILADLAVIRTGWELWRGDTDENVCYHALKMNARNLLEKRANGTLRAESIEGLMSAAAARGEDLDFPSGRLEDQDPLEVLLARDAEQERNDELSYALRNVSCRGNRWILQTEWWKKSGFSALTKRGVVAI